MLDVSAKFDTRREAVAIARVRASAETLKLVAERRVPKGDLPSIAAAAGMLAAKRTADLIPHCHPVPLAGVDVRVEAGADAIEVRVRVVAVWKTGVEMEALTAAAVAALTVYDLLKFTKDDTLAVTEVRLEEKSGGDTDWKESGSGLRAGVVVVSTSTARGEREDRSGRAIRERLLREGLAVPEYRIIPDDQARIAEEVLELADTLKLDLVVTTGGTGLSPDDVTVAALEGLLERTAPGVAEAARAYGQRRTPFAMLSRLLAGVRGSTVVLALPGSTRGASESLDALLPGLLHAFPMLRRKGHPPGGPVKPGG